MSYFMSQPKIRKVFFFFLFVCNFLFANSVSLYGEVIELEKKYRVKELVSLEVTNSESVNLVYVKNRETKEDATLIFTYKGKEPSLLAEIIRFPKKVLDVYLIHNNYVFLVMDTIKELPFVYTVVINSATKNVKASDYIPKKEFSTALNTKSNLYLVSNTDKRISIRLFENGSFREFRLNKFVNPKISTFFTNKAYEYVDNNEFVKLGSISTKKVYVNKDTLVFTSDNIKKGESQLLKLSGFNSEKLKYNSFSKKLFTNEVHLKRMATYIFENHFFQLGITKDKKLFYKSWNLTTLEKTNNFEITSSFVNSHYKGNRFSSFKKFMRFARKIKHTITLTANATKDNRTLIRIDYSYPEYGYYDNFWFHQRMFLQMNHSFPVGFGPNIVDDYFIFNEDNGDYFQFLINDKGAVEEYSKPLLVFQDTIDYSETRKKYNNTKKFSKTSNIFVGDKYFMFGYDKKRNSLFFDSKDAL